MGGALILQVAAQGAHAVHAHFMPHLSLTIRHLGTGLLEHINRAARPLNGDQCILRAVSHKDLLALQGTAGDQILCAARNKSGQNAELSDPPRMQYSQQTGKRSALAEATKRSYMRPNAVDAVSGKNSGNNLGGEDFPSIHFEETDGDTLTIELMLKGGGCENVGAQYTLPDNRLNAGRDLAGVRKVVLDAVQKAQGQGCAPGILGVAVGGDRGTSYYASKEIFFDQLGTRSSDPKLAGLEERISRDANKLGIGPMGFGGETTVIDTKITGKYRLPASFFVTISYMCWAYRRRKMVYHNGDIQYS